MQGTWDSLFTDWTVAARLSEAQIIVIESISQASKAPAISPVPFQRFKNNKAACLKHFYTLSLATGQESLALCPPRVGHLPCTGQGDKWAGSWELQVFHSQAAHLAAEHAQGKCGWGKKAWKKKRSWQVSVLLIHRNVLTIESSKALSHMQKFVWQSQALRISL